MSIFWQKLKSRIGAFWRREAPTRRATVDIEYKEFVCIIEPKSSFLTPLQADTLWAALMWTHYYLHGDAQKTRKLVESDPPQILVSDGFPDGYLPKPKNFIPIEEVGDIVRSVYGDDWDKQLMGIEIAKRLAEQQWLPVELVNRLVAGESERKLLKRLLKVELCPKRFIETSRWGGGDSQEIAELIDTHCNAEGCDAVISWKNPYLKRKSHHNCTRILGSKSLNYFKLSEPNRVRKNRIDRVLMRAMEENGLYSQEEKYLLHNQWWVFVRLHPEFSDEEMRELFRKLAIYGYGKRKFVGKGQFDFQKLTEQTGNLTGVQTPTSKEPDGFMTLSSSYVPCHGEFTQCRYTTHIKRGKVDGHLATTGKYLKKPIVMYEAGSVFQTEKFQPYYGRFVKNIYEAEREGVVQYGYAFPLKGKFFTEGKND